MRFPDFYVIGPHKTATTWLYNVLAEHPLISRGYLKETFYFTEIYEGQNRAFARRMRLRALQDAIGEQLAGTGVIDQRRLDVLAAYGLPDSLTDAAYAALYNGASPDKLVFDCTPSTHRISVEGIEHLKRLSPQAKIVIILRNPLDRLVSMIGHRLAANSLSTGTKEITTEMTAAAFRHVASLEDYHSWMPRWHQAFSSENLHCSFFEDLHDGQRGVDALCVFLGVDPRLAIFPSIGDVIGVRSIRWQPDPEMLAALYRLARPSLDYLAEKVGGHALRWRQEAATVYATR